MQAKFNIGDTVMINATAYGIFGKTTPGSAGVIRSINYLPNHLISYTISFFYLASEDITSPKKFTIHERYLHLIKSEFKEVDKPYAKVINKIKYLNKKFESRKGEKHAF